MWANAHRYGGDEQVTEPYPALTGPKPDEYQGWPFSHLVFPGDMGRPVEWLLSGLFVNIFAALIVFAITAVACEWLIRRREAKKQEAEV